MRRYLFDSGIMGDFINHRHGVDARVRVRQGSGDRLGTCIPVVGELFAGVEASATREKNLRRLRASLSRLVCWPYDRSAAEEFGKIMAELRRPADRTDRRASRGHRPEPR